jgi:dihydrofolate synthase / folylpolyglutamate synthase
VDILEKLFPHLKNWEKDRKGKFTLKNIFEELKLFGNPQYKLKCIHITGSKGKGSFAHILGGLLQGMGFRVGIFTSPHLIKINERIRVNNKCISDNEFGRYCNLIRRVIRKYKKETELTYFEILTLISFLYFFDKKVDYAVYEVGIGGRLDATNIIESVFQVITSIEYEHTEILGNTLEKIFLEKLGIAKGCAPLILVDIPFNLLPLVFIAKLKKEEKIYIYRRDFGYISSDKRTIFWGLYGSYKLDNFEVINNKLYPLISGAIFVAEYLLGKKLPIKLVLTLPQTLMGLFRIGIFSYNPLIIIDVSHTTESVKNLVESVSLKFPQQAFYVLFSAMKNKNVVGMLYYLNRIAKRFIFCRNDSKNSYLPWELASLNNIYIKGEYIICEDIEGAIAKVIENNFFPLIICGSFYNVEKAIATLRKHKGGIKTKIKI